MHAASQTAYQALRDYLDALRWPNQPDQALADVPAALHPNLEAFLSGRTEYEDAAGRRMIYAADLAAWAVDVVHGSGLAVALPLASLSVAELRTATGQATAG